MAIFGFYVELWAVAAVLTFMGIALITFLIWGILAYERYPKSTEYKKYAFFIPARNEENVIAKTIESIRAMDYPQDKITIFILANNCFADDKTAEIARDMGEEVFELNDKSVNNVGQVLEKFFEYIKERFGGYGEFDGYVRLDADSLTDKNFLSELNDAFCIHPTVIVAYKSSQNFNGGVRAGLTCTLVSQAMTAFRLFSAWKANPIITGAGVLIAAEILAKMDGWHCKSISEDVELSALLVKLKIKSYFCCDAVFYDEQPKRMRIIWRQRLRWTAGTNQVFCKYWFIMVSRVFSRMWLSALFLVIGLMPMGFLTVTFTTAFAVYGFITALVQHTFTPIFLFIILPFIINIIIAWVMTIVTFLVESNRICISFFKKVLYTIFSPVSYAIQNLTDFFRIFITIKWKPIPHGQIGATE
jgi:cellulose synthase/poly-beta-1,6-N-acetylglucosamine synthase-like glycosyltransferase